MSDEVAGERRMRFTGLIGPRRLPEIALPRRKVVENMIAALVLTPLAFVGLRALLAGYLWFFGRSLRSSTVQSG